MSDSTDRTLARLAGVPETAVVLGSGLTPAGRWPGLMEDVSYGDLEGFPVPTIEGHPGRLLLLGGSKRKILVFSGRTHLYENGEPACIPRLASELGCRSILLTQAAGSLRPGLSPGSWMLASDIISLPWSLCREIEKPSDAPHRSPGPLLSPPFRAKVAGAAASAGVRAEDGVLYWTTGPNYETPAEARMAAGLGADAATMSPLPELIEARRQGLEAACLSWITNYAPNVSGAGTGHDGVVKMGRKGSGSLAEVIGALASLR